ncbi:MAG: hypothetical protein V3S42_03260 [Candidatus Neomarinimicrobiota bacterium]
MNSKTLIEEEKSDFSMSKWYMDCIDTNGNVFIGYSAVLKWKKIKLNYTNILYYDGLGKPTERSTLRKLPSPGLKNNCMTWDPSKLQTRGTWNRIDAPLRKTLLNTEVGTIRWDCFQPKANANILNGNNKIITGFGYAEKLDMTIKPWELPFNELRWGRFLSEKDTIIWVIWTGDTNCNLLFHNGKSIKDAIVSDECVDINQRELLLTFSDKLVLRKGSLISTALSNLPGLTGIFPSKVLNTYECKWRSRGILTRENKKVSDGWVIHEVIRWH